ncbi:hypothetical protein N7451_011021 [Penicillium sp. IBT 35674x]|nr:hypothetical protein N7451_011021 [Penicillium sp. IBT 35674x]
MKSRAEKGYFVGYVASKIWQIWIPHRGQVRVVQDTVFDETRRFSAENHDPTDRVEQPEPDPLAVVGYACLYWVEHLEKCSHQFCANSIDDFTEGDTIEAFLRNNYLHWLEAISLMKSMSEGTASILKLEKLIENAFDRQSDVQNANLIDRAKDASRFVLYHQMALSIGRFKSTQGHTDQVNSVSFSQNSRLLASAFTDRIVKIWSSSTGVCLATLEHGAKVESVCFSPDSKLLASALVDSTIQLWDLGEWRRVMAMEDDSSDFVSVTLFECQNKKDKKDKTPISLASGSSDGTLKLWDTHNGRCFKIIKGHRGPVSEVRISQGCQLLASASLDSTIKIWDLKSASYSVAFSHDSKLLISSSLDQKLKLWKTGTWECLQTFGGSTTPGSIYSPKFSHDSRLVASGSRDDTVILWDTSSGQRIHSFSGHRDSVYSTAFSHDSQRLASASSDRTVRIWDATSSQHLIYFESHCYAIPVFSDDSGLLASLSESDPHYIQVWNARNGRCLQSIKVRGYRPHTLMFSSDLRFLGSYSSDNTVRVWDISNGECIEVMSANMGASQCFSDNPDLRSFDGTFELSSVFDGPNEHSPLTLPHVPESGIGIRGECITWNSECLLWLPPDYRPAGSSSTFISKSTVCICCASGRVLFFTFDSAMLSVMLTAPNVR